jgi:hypothetical protein
MFQQTFASDRLRWSPVETYKSPSRTEPRIPHDIVASPRAPENSAARASTLAECLKNAGKHLDETSRASKTEKDEIPIAGAVEGCAYLCRADDEPAPASPQPTIGLIPALNS